LKKEEGNAFVPFSDSFCQCKYTINKSYVPNNVKVKVLEIVKKINIYFCLMNIFRIAAEIFLIYILYKLIFEFIIPVYQSTKKIKKQFGEMHAKMQQDMHTYDNRKTTPQPEPAVKKEDDYIEFEEVK